MGLITPIPMPQKYKIGAQSGPCNTQVHRTQTIIGGPLTQKSPRARQSTRTVAAVKMGLSAPKSDRAIKKSALTTSTV
mgnify:CR=1 FL=1